MLGMVVGLGVLWPASGARASQRRVASPSVSLAVDGAGFRRVNLSFSFAGMPVFFNDEVEYGPTTAYGFTCCGGAHDTDPPDTAGGSQTPPLDDGTTYHFRLKAWVGTDTYYSNDVTATTMPSGPPLIDFYNPVPANLDSTTGCFEGAVQINTKGGCPAGAQRAAVLPDRGVHRSRVDPEAHVRQRMDTAIGLRQALQLDECHRG